MSEKEGGPAFPISIPGVGDNGMGGMSLRDWFAGQALIGLASDMSHLQTIRNRGDDPAAVSARTAYLMADSMLAERSRTP